MTAVLQIILGPVADRYGRRPVLLGCLVLFVLASICGQFFGWRSGFWLYAAMVGALLWLTWADLGETNPAQADTFADQLHAYSELFRS